MFIFEILILVLTVSLVMSLLFNMGPEKYENCVYICSPYRGDVDRNLKHARKLCRFALIYLRMTPICPHIFYTQFLNDDDPTERNLGKSEGFKHLKKCKKILVDNCVRSEGMKAEIEYAIEHDIEILYLDTYKDSFYGKF